MNSTGVTMNISKNMFRKGKESGRVDFCVIKKSTMNPVHSNIYIWECLNKDLQGKYGKSSFYSRCEDIGGLSWGDLKSCNEEKMNKSKSESDGPVIPQFIYFDNISFKLPAEDFFGLSSPTKKGYRHMTLSELLLKKYQLKQKMSKLLMEILEVK